MRKFFFFLFYHRKHLLKRGKNIIRMSSSTSTGSINIGELVRKREADNKIYCSFELIPRVDHQHIYGKMKEQPLFFALTWHIKCFSESLVPLQVLPQFPKNTLLHLSARGLKFSQVEEVLKRVLDLKITNLLILRGDKSIGDGDFEYAVDLVEFIKQKFGSKFCIGVAGYPDAHPESPSKELDLFYLKKKVDAGASFIISQILFESQSFMKFVEDCRSCGITVPIIPGIFPIMSYKSLISMEKICNVKIPDNLRNNLYKIRNENEKIEEYGINLATKIVNEIISSKIVNGFHLFTLNNSTVTRKICKKIFTKFQEEK